MVNNVDDNDKDVDEDVININENDVRNVIQVERDIIINGILDMVVIHENDNQTDKKPIIVTVEMVDANLEAYETKANNHLEKIVA